MRSPRARALRPARRRAGQVLLLEHSDDLRVAAPRRIQAGMETLQRRQRATGPGAALPLWTFIVLDEAEFDALG